MNSWPIKLTAAVLLAACGHNLPTLPPWALGEQPNFSGTILNWAKGDAIAPGEGGIFANTYVSDPEGTFIGIDSIRTDASFSFGLQRGAGAVNGGFPPSQTLCSGLNSSNPGQTIAVVEVMNVLPLYEAGVHARPGGAIFLSVGQPLSPSFKEAYTFYYASQDGSLKGSCDLEFVGLVAFDLDLRKGWNSIRRDGSGFKSAAISKEARWYFVNTLTAGE